MAGEVLAFDPHRARTFLHKLRGAAHRYAWAYYQWRRHKGPEPSMRSVGALSGDTKRAIRMAIGVGMGQIGPTPAPATFKGWQERPGGKPPIALFNLRSAIPGHPAGSTVSGQTLVRAGFALPETPEPNGLIYTGGGGRNPGVPHDPNTIIVNGILYDIIGTTHDAQGELLMIRRPKGSKEYLARRLPDSPLYGGGRGAIIHGLLRSRGGNPRGPRFKGAIPAAGVWRDATLAERALILDVLKGLNGSARSITRRGSREFDIDVKGFALWSKDAPATGFELWLPLAAIRELTPWTSPEVAEMTDYPEMASTGDWSGVRDSSVPAIWRIFDRFVKPQLRDRGHKVNPRARRPQRNPADPRGPHVRSWGAWAIRPDAITIEEGAINVVVHVGRKLLKPGESTSHLFRVYRSIDQAIRGVRAMRKRYGYPDVYLWPAKGPQAGYEVKMFEFHKSNPPRGARAGGGARLIYPSGRIRGVWEGRHKNGKLYRHRFGRGLKSVYGLPGGDLLITAHQGRLWKTFR